MSSILHRQTINAAPEHVQDLVATKKGIEPWWTGQPVDGNDSVGGEIAVSFGDRTAATFQIAERTPERVVWRCVSGPHDWIDTRVTFILAPRADGGTTLRFRHEGWQKRLTSCTAAPRTGPPTSSASSPEPKGAASAPSLTGKSAAGTNPAG
jgi:uncharacterized protein YndB with AHSA1/START domain